MSSSKHTELPSGVRIRDPEKVSLGSDREGKPQGIWGPGDIPDLLTPVEAVCVCLLCNNSSSYMLLKVYVLSEVLLLLNKKSFQKLFVGVSPIIVK